MSKKIRREAVKRGQDWEKELTENGAFKFWDKYFSANILERRKILEPIIKRFKELANFKDIPKNRIDESYELALTSYLDDIENYFLIKEGLDE